MHISYLMLFTMFISKRIVGKRYGYIITIIVLILYVYITGFSPSIIRAVIMGIIYIISKLIYRQNDTLTNISISAILILIINPYLIYDLGFIFSFSGTIGIVLFNKSLSKINEKENMGKFKKFISEIILVTISAQIVLLPISMYIFNQISAYFLLSNLLVGIIIGPLMFISFVFLGAIILGISKAQFISKIVEILIKILIQISNISNFPKSIIYIKSFNILFIILYFISISLIFIIVYIMDERNYDIRCTRKRIKNIKEMIKFKIKYRISSEKKKKAKKIFCSIIIIVLVINIFNIQIITKDLEIHFVDVGQGDCTYIKTPEGKNILIDGGGSNSYDVGEKVLLPYLLKRGCIKVDVIIISHFDTDHVGGILTIMDKLKVSKVYIPKIGKKINLGNNNDKSLDNYRKFFKIAKNKKIKVKEVEIGDKINIENKLYFEILWPDSKNIISEKMLNNNSIVAKLHYNNKFKMLFTGDIESIAEEKILETKTDLRADILKIAHHGSKSSTNYKLLKEVKPKIALIGVGENNLFGHPSNEVLDLLKKEKVEIYRTDIYGEISIVVSRKGQKVILFGTCLKRITKNKIKNKIKK